MVITRSREGVGPPETSHHKPNLRLASNQKGPTVRKSTTNSKTKKAAPASVIETVASQEPEAAMPAKQSKNSKAPPKPAPAAKLDYSDSTPSKPPKRRNILTPAPRADPLPDCGTNRHNIGGPDRPRPKRTTAQVQEELARRAQLQSKLDDMEAEKLRLLAEMEAQQERDEAEEEAVAARGFEDELVDEDDVEVDTSSDDDGSAPSAGSSRQKVQNFLHLRSHKIN